MATTPRVVKHLKTGEIFAETPISHWYHVLLDWQYDHTKPCPMPVGHLMFERPQDYSCATVKTTDD